MPGFWSIGFRPKPSTGGVPEVVTKGFEADVNTRSNEKKEAMASRIAVT